MPIHCETPTPKCPHCGHEMRYDEMDTDVDLFALAPQEDRAVIEHALIKTYKLKPPSP